MLDPSFRIHTQIIRVLAHIENKKNAEEDVFLCLMKDQVKRWFMRRSLSSPHFTYQERELVQRYCERNHLCVLFHPVELHPAEERIVHADVVPPKKTCPCAIL
jgi:hypothetical protein